MKKRIFLLLSLLPIILACRVGVCAAGADTTPDVPLPRIQTVSVKLVSAPDKVSYFVGDELECAGGRIEVTFSDKSSRTVDIEPEWCSGFDNTVENTGKVSVQYPDGGNAVTFGVSVKNRLADRIIIRKAPAKLVYYTGDTLSLDGIVVEAEYNGGKHTDISSAVSAGEVDMSTPGQKTVYVYYYAEGKRFQAEYTVTVNEVTATGIELLKKPSVTEYYDGAEPDFSGISVRVTFSDGSVTLTRDYTDPSQLTFEGYNKEKLGVQRVTVAFGDVSTNFTVLTVLSPDHVHVPGEYTVTKEPTCSEEGVESSLCRICGELTDERPTGLAPHTWNDWIIMEPATETVRGKMERICSVCAAKDDAVIPALNEETLPPDTSAEETSSPADPGTSSADSGTGESPDEDETTAGPENTSHALTTGAWTPVTSSPDEPRTVDVGNTPVSVIIIIIAVALLIVGGLVAALCYGRKL